MNECVATPRVGRARVRCAREHVQGKLFVPVRAALASVDHLTSAHRKKHFTGFAHRPPSQTYEKLTATAIAGGSALLVWFDFWQK